MFCGFITTQDFKLFICWFLLKYFYVKQLFRMQFPNICAYTSCTQNCLCRNYPWPLMVCSSVLIICCFFLIIHELDCKLRHSITVEKADKLSRYITAAVQETQTVCNPMCVCIFMHADEYFLLFSNTTNCYCTLEVIHYLCSGSKSFYVSGIVLGIRDFFFQ